MTHQGDCSLFQLPTFIFTVKKGWHLSPARLATPAPPPSVGSKKELLLINLLMNLVLLYPFWILTPSSSNLFKCA